VSGTWPVEESVRFEWTVEGGGRSRISDGRWQVNSGHRDFRDVDARPALKLRHLAMLFAKEIVVNDSADPRLAAPLEKLVEISAYVDRKLVGGRGKRGTATRREEEVE
jgi:hypothetical protein